MNRSQKEDSNKKIFVASKATYVATAPNDLLGKGTYGVVYRARNENNPDDVKAIKTFTPETMDENEGIPPTTLREINALKVLQHPNVLKADEIVLPRGEQALVEMFVVMELCQGTLKDKVCEMIHRHLKSDPKYFAFPQGNCPANLRLPNSYVSEAKLLAYQLLNALAYIHSRGVVHRDLKPVNIMWGFDDLLKFGDFGLARFMRGNQNSKNNVLPITGEVQTMWYRAPEVLLGDESYGAQVDDWSVGCIIAELFRFRKSRSTNRVEPEPLFNGRSDPETLLMIFETLGRPHVEADPGKEYLAKLPYWSSEFPKWDLATLQNRVPLLDEAGLELVSNLLKVSPCERFVAKHLLNHRWFDDVRVEIKKSFVPWSVGLERAYEIMAAVDRLPPAQPLAGINSREAQERQKDYKGFSLTSGRTTNSEMLCNNNKITKISQVKSSTSLALASQCYKPLSTSFSKKCNKGSKEVQISCNLIGKTMISEGKTSCIIETTVQSNSGNDGIDYPKETLDQHNETILSVKKLEMCSNVEQKKRPVRQRINETQETSTIYQSECCEPPVNDNTQTQELVKENMQKPLSLLINNTSSSSATADSHNVTQNNVSNHLPPVNPFHPSSPKNEKINNKSLIVGEFGRQKRNYHNVADSLCVNGSVALPETKRTRAVTRGKQPSGATRRNRMVAESKEGNTWHNSYFIMKPSVTLNASVSTLLSVADKENTDRTATGISDTHEIQKNGVDERQSDADKSPPHQMQLPFVKILNKENQKQQQQLSFIPAAAEQKQISSSDTNANAAKVVSKTRRQPQRTKRTMAMLSHTNNNQIRNTLCLNSNQITLKKPSDGKSVFKH